MARIYPFRALRYDISRVNMEDVVTQPYDKITPEMQQRYYDASPYNLIRVILGKRLPGDTEAPDFLPPGEQAHNVYTRAARPSNPGAKKTSSAKIRARSLRLLPDLYRPPYRRSPRTPRLHRPRTPLRLRRQGRLPPRTDLPQAQIRPLALFKATRAYCEQIYMLYSDPAFTAEKLIFGAKSPNGFDDNPADLAITDEYGVVHKVWRLTDPSLINLLVTAMADKKLIIAPQGSLPMELPSSMDAVRASRPDVPFDTADPLFPFGHGLRY